MPDMIRALRALADSFGEEGNLAFNNGSKNAGMLHAMARAYRAAADALEREERERFSAAPAAAGHESLVERPRTTGGRRY